MASHKAILLGYHSAPLHLCMATTLSFFGRSLHPQATTDLPVALALKTGDPLIQKNDQKKLAFSMENPKLEGVPQF